MGEVEATLRAIDDANRLDPNLHRGEPLALAQGCAASRWLDQLVPDASDELRLAVRAHHLRRWELSRQDYPEGRAGYLRWRRDNKTHQADSLASIMRDHGWPDESIERATTLLARTKLRSDPETQALEDAACLVFIETQFDDMVERTEHDHMVSIVAKTLKKMSPDAVSLAAGIGLAAPSQTVLADAVQLLGADDTTEDTENTDDD